MENKNSGLDLIIYRDAEYKTILVSVLINDEEKKCFVFNPMCSIDHSGKHTVYILDASKKIVGVFKNYKSLSCSL